MILRDYIRFGAFVGITLLIDELIGAEVNSAGFLVILALAAFYTIISAIREAGQ